MLGREVGLLGESGRCCLVDLHREIAMYWLRKRMNSRVLRNSLAPPRAWPEKALQHTEDDTECFEIQKHTNDENQAMQAAVIILRDCSALRSLLPAMFAPGMNGLDTKPLQTLSYPLMRSPLPCSLRSPSLEGAMWSSTCPTLTSGRTGTAYRQTSPGLPPPRPRTDRPEAGALLSG